MIKMKPRGKLAYLDMHDPWNRLRGNGVAIMFKPKRNIISKNYLIFLATLNSITKKLNISKNQLGILAQAGQRGSLAGTNLRNVLLT